MALSAILPFIPALLGAAGGLYQGSREMNMQAPPPVQEPEPYGYMSGGGGGMTRPDNGQLATWLAQNQQRQRGMDMLSGTMGSLGQIIPGISGAMGAGGSGGYGSPGSWLGGDTARNSMLGGNNQPYGFFDPSLYGKPGFGF